MQQLKTTIPIDELMLALYSSLNALLNCDEIVKRRLVTDWAEGGQFLDARRADNFLIFFFEVLRQNRDLSEKIFGIL